MNAKSSKSRVVTASEGAPIRQRAKRLPAEARKEIILKEASDFFAENGFAASTRDLADRIGVRQALLYKYFPSKEALIESVFSRVIEEREASPRGALSANENLSLTVHIADVYDHMATLANGSGVRLISRAMLQDQPIGIRLAAFLKQKLFDPMLSEIRRLEGLPGIVTKPMLLAEFELIMAFHASALFFILRRDLQNMPLPKSAPLFFHVIIEAFLTGARASLRDLHAGKLPVELSEIKGAP